MTSREFEVCNCDCHDEYKEVRHIMACCYECSFCHKRIKGLMYWVHNAFCNLRPKGEIDE